MENKRLHTDDYLDQILQSEPDFTLSAEFEKKLSKKVERIVSWEAYFKQFFIWIAIGVFTLLIAVGVLFFTQEDTFVKGAHFVKEHYQLTLTAIFLICSVAFFDTVLLNYLFYRYQKRE